MEGPVVDSGVVESLGADLEAEAVGPNVGPNGRETVAIAVSGMKCAGCVRAVETRLRNQLGVEAAVVNLVTQVALVEYVPERVAPEAIAADLGRLGFPAQVRTGLAQSQPSHEPSSESPLGVLGVIRQSWVQPSEASRAMTLAIAAVLIGLSSLGHLPLDLGPFRSLGWHWLLATLTLVGPGRGIVSNGAQGLRHGVPNMNTLVGLGALSAYTASCVALLKPEWGLECFFDEPVMMLGFILLGRTLEERARERAMAALRALVQLQPQTAQVIADPTVVGMVEDQRGSGYSAGVNQDEAVVFNRLLNSRSLTVAIAEVRVGEWLRVLPGERVPVDGRVMAGRSAVDESMLTGESQPVDKAIGSVVSAGSLNLSSPLVMTVERTGAQTTLAQIITLVETAQARKAPIQRLADTVAGYFVYGVIAIALVTFGFWYGWGCQWWPQVLSAGDWMLGMHSMASHASMAQLDAMGATMGETMVATPHSPLVLSLRLAIAVLVIACPCALGLATPTAMLVGSGVGAERGLLLRGADVLERMERVDTVVFDKTGTLTTGRLQLSDGWSPGAGWQALRAGERIEQSELVAILQWAASLEAQTNHPIGRALVKAAQAQGLELLAVTGSLTQAGLGVVGTIAGRTYGLGSLAWLGEQGIAGAEAAAKAHSLAQQGKTVVYLSEGQQLRGALALTDQLRPDAVTSLRALHARGLRLILLSGDRRETATAIATPLPLAADAIIAEVTPAGKAEAIAELQRQGHCVVMVGDGINDAPALAQADIGMALGSGTDVALETADIVLRRDRLTDVEAALELGRLTLSKIRQNLFWALVYNLLMVPLAAGVLLPHWGIALNPAIAGFVMTLSSLSVVTNSLHLRQRTSEKSWLKPAMLVLPFCPRV